MTAEKIVGDWINEHPQDLELLWKLLVKSIAHMNNPEEVRVALSFSMVVERANVVYRMSPRPSEEEKRKWPQTPKK